MNSSKGMQFTQLMDEHKGIIYKVVNAYCHHQEDRQDLAQEILTAMWLAIDNYNNEFKFSTWMYRIALNVAISYYRKDSKRKDKANTDDELLINIIEPDESEQTEDIKQLYRFIEQLDKLNKAIIILYLEGESYQSIAEHLGLSKTNVATKIGRIKQTLTKYFQNQEKVQGQGQKQIQQ